MQTSIPLPKLPFLAPRYIHEVTRNQSQTACPEVAAGADEWVPDSHKDLIFSTFWRKLTQSRSGNLTLKARQRDSPNQPGEAERGRVELEGRKEQLCSRDLSWGEAGSLISSQEKLYPLIDPHAPPPTLAIHSRLTLTRALTGRAHRAELSPAWLSSGQGCRGLGSAVLGRRAPLLPVGLLDWTAAGAGERSYPSS